MFTVSSPDIIYHNRTESVTFPEIDAQNSSVTTIDFGFAPSASVTDGEVSSTTTPFRPGFEGIQYVTVRNNGTVPFSGTLETNYDQLLNVDLVKTEEASHNSSTGILSWSIDNLQPGQSLLKMIFYHIPADLSLGTELTFQNSLAATGTEHTLNDNLYNHTVMATGSYDPNDKVLLVNSIEAPATATHDDIFDYRIRFQNTGNDTAFTVIVKDTLEQNLDLSTFKIIGGSHPFTASLDTNRILTFTFADVNLPYSTTSEALSHGYILFRIKPDANIPEEKSIKNTAAIYFDFNAPVITNTSSVMISYGTISGIADKNQQIEIYPNPAEDYIYIKDGKDVQYKIYDLSGRVLQTRRSNGTVNISSLPPGLYHIQLSTDEIAWITFTLSKQ